MKCLTLYLILVGLLQSASPETQLVDLCGEIILPVPAGWSVSDENPDYPFAIVNETWSSELLIFRTQIAPDAAISSVGELKAAVNGVIDEVIMTLPDSRLMSSTGYHDTSRARFEIEYMSVDTAAHITVCHRLLGIIYRHPDGHQLLFTLWAKSPLDVYTSISSEIRGMQDGFTYTGPIEEDVFSTGSNGAWQYGCVALLAVALLLYRRRRNRHVQKGTDWGELRYHRSRTTG